jgi:RNA polymerase-binding protein DksA
MARSTRKSLASSAASAARKVISRKKVEPAGKAAPAKKVGAPAKKAAAKKASAPAKKSAAKKAAPAKKTSAPAKKAAAPATKTATATKKASAVKKAAAPAKKTTAAKKAAAPAKKTTVAKKAAPAKKAPAKKAAAPAKKTTVPASKSSKSVSLKVKEGEGAWTKAEIKEVTDELRGLRQKVAATLAEQEAELAGLMRDAGDGAGHDQADMGATSFERDHELSVVNNEREKLAQIDRALARIADGSYGICESCGNPIGKMRVMAFPRATLCLTCKQREERR